MDASVERDRVELEVEALAVLVLPSGPDAGPEAFVFAVPYLIGDMGWGIACWGSGCFGVTGHGILLRFGYRPHHGA